MSLDWREYGACAKAITFFPFGDDVVAATVLLNDRLVSSAKNSLPCQAKAVAEVAHVHPLLFDKAVSHRRLKALKDLATVGNRGFTSVCRRCVAEEKYLHRISLLIRILVMQENVVAGRIIS